MAQQRTPSKQQPIERVSMATNDVTTADGDKGVVGGCVVTAPVTEETDEHEDEVVNNLKVSE